MTIEKAKKIISMISLIGIILSILIILSGAYFILQISLGNNILLDFLGITKADAGKEFLKVFNFYQIYIGACLLIFGALFLFVFEKLKEYHNWARWFLICLSALSICLLLFVSNWFSLLIIPFSFLLVFLLFFDEVNHIFHNNYIPNHRKNLRIKRMIHTYHNVELKNMKEEKNKTKSKVTKKAKKPKKPKTKKK
jgi:magnesium-transporting ATPase (P-type)